MPTMKAAKLTRMMDCAGRAAAVALMAWSDQAIVSQFREYLFIEPFASFGQAAEFLIRCVPSGTHGLVKLEKRKVELQRSSDLIDWHTIMVKDNLKSITHFKDSASPHKNPRLFYRARYSL